MPKENFYEPSRGPEDPPDLELGWNREGMPDKTWRIAGELYGCGEDTSGLDRLIKALKRVRRAMRDQSTREDLAVDLVMANQCSPHCNGGHRTVGHPA